MGGLKVLITNNALDARAGTETYVRDLALGLLKRGHKPVAYSTRIGDVGLELRRATVPVVDDLRKLSTPPDIIHGHHHAETMTALLHFQRVPAVFVCHGWLPWEETPPRFPRILRYVAVDDLCRERLVCEHGIEEERVRTVYNFVDLERFRPRGPLPERPRRALVFSNYAGEATHLGAVREACSRSGLALDVAGSQSGNSCDAPENILGQYDLVFAKARCALEAMAVGTAVVLCDATGSGPLVTTGEVTRLRRLNFGIRTLQNDLDPEVIVREIERYDAVDAAEVSRRVRGLANGESAVDQIVALYREALEEHGSGGACDAAAEGRAAADYIRWLLADIGRERKDLKQKWEAFTNSPTARLRQRMLAIPVLGPLIQSLSKRLG